jgi:asparagine synthetase B (glutamine-hydrolysing)
MPRKKQLSFEFSGSEDFFRVKEIGIFCLDNRLPGDRKVNDPVLLEKLIRRYKKDREGFLSYAGDFCGIAVCDFIKGTLLVASDKVGHFPFYFSTAGGRILVSERISVFLKQGYKEISRKSFASYVRHGYVSGAETILAGVKKVCPGQYLFFKKGCAAVKRYHGFTFQQRPQKREKLSLSIRTALKETVQFYARSQKTGLMLSGGFDSALLCFYLTKARVPFHSFTLGLEPYNHQTILQARNIAGIFGAHHHEIFLRPADYISNFPEAVGALDEPVFDMDISVIRCALKNIPRDIRFVLHGFGSDEVFGDRLNPGGKKRLGREGLVSYVTQKCPQELVLHDKVGQFFHSRLIFPFLNYAMLRIGVHMPEALRAQKNLIRGLEPALRPLFPRASGLSGGVPGSLKKALRIFFTPKIEKSPFLAEMLGRKNVQNIVQTQNNNAILPLVFFQVWLEQKSL